MLMVMAMSSSDRKPDWAWNVKGKSLEQLQWLFDKGYSVSHAEDGVVNILTLYKGKDKIHETRTILLSLGISLLHSRVKYPSGI